MSETKTILGLCAAITLVGCTTPEPGPVCHSVPGPFGPDDWCCTEPDGGHHCASDGQFEPDTTFFAVGDVAAHEGYVVEMLGPAWPEENGWTEGDVRGAHGTILGEFETREEAEARVAEFLLCDAPATGAYCYAHNPGGGGR